MLLKRINGNFACFGKVYSHYYYYYFIEILVYQKSDMQELQVTGKSNMQKITFTVNVLIKRLLEDKVI